MKVHLIYFSPGGTTAKTVRNIAEGMNGCEIIEYNMLRKENREKEYRFKKDDLVILGMPTATKLFGLPKEIIEKLKGEGTPLVGVVTCGNGYYGKSLIVMRSAVEKNGFRMIAGGGFVGQYSFNKEIAKGRPDEKDQRIQRSFGEEILKKVKAGDLVLHEKLKIDWPKEGMFSTVKCALISASPGLGGGLPQSWNELKVLEKCIRCGKCVRHCPVEAIKLGDRIEFDRKKCIGCFGCANVCPVGAIKTANDTMKKMTEDVMRHRHGRKEPDIFL